MSSPPQAITTVPQAKFAHFKEERSKRDARDKTEDHHKQTKRLREEELRTLQGQEDETRVRLAPLVDNLNALQLIASSANSQTSASMQMVVYDPHSQALPTAMTQLRIATNAWLEVAFPPQQLERKKELMALLQSEQERCEEDRVAEEQRALLLSAPQVNHQVWFKEQLKSEPTRYRTHSLRYAYDEFRAMMADTVGLCMKVIGLSAMTDLVAIVMRMAKRCVDQEWTEHTVVATPAWMELWLAHLDDFWAAVDLLHWIGLTKPVETPVVPRYGAREFADDAALEATFIELGAELGPIHYDEVLYDAITQTIRKQTLQATLSYFAIMEAGISSARVRAMVHATNMLDCLVRMATKGVFTHTVAHSKREMMELWVVHAEEKASMDKALGEFGSNKRIKVE